VRSRESPVRTNDLRNNGIHMDTETLERDLLLTCMCHRRGFGEALRLHGGRR